MNYTEQDFIETRKLAATIKTIDLIDAAYVNQVTDEIFKSQPFFLSVFLDYRHELTPFELEEVMKVHFIIWEYFKDKANIRTKAVTQILFEKMEKKNIKMLHLAQDESLSSERDDIYKNDLDTMKSKSLMTAVLYRFTERPTLVSMNDKMKTITLIDIKTFVECFEIIEQDKDVR